MIRRCALLAGVIALLAAACGDDSAVDVDGSGGPGLLGEVIEGQPRVALETIADGLRGPVDMDQPPGDDRMFILQVRDGTIVILEDGEVRDEPFLDISERLAENGEGEERGRGERGLLSMAFHPAYADNGRFFVWYADESGIAELVEYTVSDDPALADAESAVVLRAYEQTTDHFGGDLRFGPDGYLWASLGDGGRRRNAQQLDVPRGGILRLDVSTPGLAVPAAGNPYIDMEGASGDLWAIGLRNPWRWSLDSESGLMFIGDPGEDVAEEINVHPFDEPGPNYGWPILEGNACFRLDEDPVECDDTGLVRPVVELLHPEACAIVGGHVYRGAALPELVGTYFYSDYCAGFVRSFVYDDGEATNPLEWFDDIGPISSYGVDHEGELYLLSTEGWLRKLVRAD